MNTRKNSLRQKSPNTNKFLTIPTPHIKNPGRLKDLQKSIEKYEEKIKGLRPITS